MFIFHKYLKFATNIFEIMAKSIIATLPHRIHITIHHHLSNQTITSHPNTSLLNELMIYEFIFFWSPLYEWTRRRQSEVGQSAKLSSSRSTQHNTTAQREANDVLSNQPRAKSEFKVDFTTLSGLVNSLRLGSSICNFTITWTWSTPVCNRIYLYVFVLPIDTWMMPSE